VVASCEVHDAGVAHLPGEEGYDDLNREGASVHEISVEEVGLALRRETIEFKDVE
jgi:hypothetical protein